MDVPSVATVSSYIYGGWVADEWQQPSQTVKNYRTDIYDAYKYSYQICNKYNNLKSIMARSIRVEFLIKAIYRGDTYYGSK